MVIAWFVAGATSVLVVWSLMRDSFTSSVFARENVHGRLVPTGAGVVLVIGALLVEGGARLALAVGIDAAAYGGRGRDLALWLGLGMAMLGLLDDLGGVGQSGGFRGHLRALVDGRLTTGALKLFGGAALAVAVVSLVEPGSLGRLLADGALIALAANLANLLDRAPGRVVKVGLVAFGVLAIGAGAPDDLAGVALIAGGAAGLFWSDVRERLMLGDAGANVLGAALGLGVVLTCGPVVRTIVLVVVITLNLLSEVVSFSGVIGRVAPLRALDRIGQRR